MIERLYQSWGISDKTDFTAMVPTDYPILSDLYDVIEAAYEHYEQEAKLQLYPREMLRDLLLGLHSMCKGAECSVLQRTHQHFLLPLSGVSA